MIKDDSTPIGIKIGSLFSDKTLPLLIEPNGEKLQNFENFENWVHENKGWIEEKLLKYGALLFRGFPVEGAENFQKVVTAYSPNLLNYVAGNSPRDLVTNKVYTSTNYPPSWNITMHNEVSYLKNVPKICFFYCLIPSKIGGETPIADCRTFLKNLDPEIKKRFIDKKIKYVQNFYDGVLGKSWQKTFETEDKSFVEDFCKKEDAQISWGKESELKITYFRDATIKHPKTGEEVWFNQADQWHSSTLDPSTKEFLLKKMKPDEIPHNSFYADGTEISDKDIEKIKNLYYDQATYFMWQKNDFLLVDNILATHGRKPFEGERKILVAMV